MRSLLGTVVNKTPVAYSGTRSKLQHLFGTKTSTEQQLAAMGGVSTLFSIVHRLSNATSQVDWKLYRSADGRGRIAGDENRREVTSHPALDVWNKPNRFMTRQELVESVQQHIDLTGEGFLLPSFFSKAKTLGPVELWPSRPDRMVHDPHPTEFLTGWKYVGIHGEELPLGLDEVIQLRMPNPMDPYRGLGPVQSLLVDLDSARSAAEFNRNFFRNSARPGGIIKLSERLSDTEYEQMIERWEEQHKGVGNAHRVAVLEHGEWVDRSFSMVDMQFAELRQVTRDVIMEAFGISKHMLGITEDVNRANAEAGAFVFAKWLIVPRLERWKQALNNDFLPLFGESAKGLEFDYCSPVDEDASVQNAERDSKVRALTSLASAGFNHEDALEMLGLPEMRYERRETNVVTETPTESGVSNDSQSA